MHYLIITNISKRANVRALLNAAVAFGCAGVFMIGLPKFDIEFNSNATNSGTVADGNDAVCTDQHQDGQQQKESTEIKLTNKDVPKSVQDVMRLSSFFIQRFESWTIFVEHCTTNEINILGIEIHDDAVNSNDASAFSFPSSDPTKCSLNEEIAFLVGNEGTGILAKHMKDCTKFVRISQYGNGTASLNVYVAASIVLFQYNQFLKTKSKVQVATKKERHC